MLLPIESYTGEPETRYALQLAPLLMLRPFELRFGEWSEVLFEKVEWRIPAERMKVNTPHIVPLSKQALGTLYGLKKLARGSARVMFPVWEARKAS